MAIIEGKTVLISREGPSKLITSYGKPPEKYKHVLVRLKDEDGTVGWGEATPLTEFTGETASTILSILDELLIPAIVGLDASQIHMAHVRMEGAAYGNSSAKAAIDMAMYDLQGKRGNVPEVALLGGIFREQIPVNRHIGIIETEAAVKKALRYQADGCKTIKMKVGGCVEKDLERIHEVRQAVGPKMNLRIDANQGYSFTDAVSLAKGLRNEKIQYFEQPIRRYAFDDLRKLRELSGVAIGADESLCSMEDAWKLIKENCVDVFVLKLIKTGGLYPASQIAALAESEGIECVVTSVFDTQLGAAHCAHLASSLNSELGCDLTCYVSQQEMAKTSHVYKNGYLLLGDTAGVGVTSLTEQTL